MAEELRNQYEQRVGTGEADEPFLIPPPLSESTDSRCVVDLFAGLGGLSAGFRREGFEVIGVDMEPVSAEVFRVNDIGEHVCADLARESVLIDAPVVIGGPPCRPWSVMNVQRRREEHDQYKLLERFFEHVQGARPSFFLMENVPSVKGDPTYRDLIQAIATHFSVEAQVVTYAHFGAATKRRRLITVGVPKGALTAADFFRHLNLERRDPARVGDQIRWLRDVQRGGYPDHEWSRLSTIDRYEDMYASGRFGWAQLSYEEPAPSFGSVAKTYILHPEAGKNGFPKRVLSVREVLMIMGFSRHFRFPAGTSRTVRYQMVADAVSPIFSAACARAAARLLWGQAAAPRSAPELEQSGEEAQLPIP